MHLIFHQFVFENYSLEYEEVYLSLLSIQEYFNVNQTLQIYRRVNIIHHKLKDIA